MHKYLFKCPSCETIMIIESGIEESYIHKSPLCPCGKSQMLDMSSNEYAYGSIWEQMEM